MNFLTVHDSNFNISDKFTYILFIIGNLRGQDSMKNFIISFVLEFGGNLMRDFSLID
ncbi:MAG: hypothetical protein LBT66_09490 [Methanobrevibacter sp.]|jgi:hypothetical protein|nr:hypothetical protein [Candidatus Methanovirga meridionalis]